VEKEGKTLEESADRPTGKEKNMGQPIRRDINAEQPIRRENSLLIEYSTISSSLRDGGAANNGGKNVRKRKEDPKTPAPEYLNMSSIANNKKQVMHFALLDKLNFLA
jgi:hypothetical protein